MQKATLLTKIAKKHIKLKKTHEGEDLVAAITAAEPELTPEEVTTVVELIEVVVEAMPEAAPEDKKDDEPPAENAETIPMPESGACPDGYNPSEDGKSCMMVKQNAGESITMPESGICPDGYNPNSEGTMCILAEPKLNSKTPKPYVLKHKFDWAVPMELDKKTYESMMLVKGVAMTSGKAKRGENMTNENVTFGAGAMSAAAMFGLAKCDIDHYEDKLPKAYVDEFGAAINDPYPVAIILDAAAEKYTDEKTGEEKIAVEFLASCTNPLVYSMIKQGKFVGCSVVDFYRKENCSACNGTDGACNCSIEGSHFLVNTFVLKGVPNAHGTWVAEVTEKDIGTLITLPSENKLKELKNKLHQSAHMQAKLGYINMAKKNHGMMILEEYLNDSGDFTDGAAGVTKFLVDEKGLPAIIARDMADYITSHKGALTHDQLEFMSGEDLNAWFKHSVQKNITDANAHMTKLIQTLATRNHADMLGKESVNYRAGDSTKACSTCRWYSAMTDMNGIQMPNGFCNIVIGDIKAADVCDRHETIQAPAADPPAADTPEPEPAESTLDIKTLNKYAQKGKHAHIQIDKNATPTQDAKAKKHIATTIEKIKSQPVFFAQKGARLMGENHTIISNLKKKPIDK